MSSPSLDHPSLDHPSLDRLIQTLLQDRRTSSSLRSLRAVYPLDSTHIKFANSVETSHNPPHYVNFATNNYLGLNTHPRILAATTQTISKFGFGTGAAALISGYTTVHASAEQAIAAWKQTEAAVLLPSGYQANLAAIQTLAAVAALTKPKRHVRFLVDKLAHASILDAVIAAGSMTAATMRVFPHNHMSKLSRLLSESDESVLNVVITESIFSMDGDAADLPSFAALKQKYSFVLMVDEAHAGGVYGPHGAGYAHECGLQESVDISVVTLSKALGGIGGAICASRAFCDGVINFGRAFIFTTSLPTAAAAAAAAAIAILRDEPHRQQRLRELSRRVRSQLTAAGMDILPGDSPIICIILGSDAAALAAADLLKNAGLLVGAVRPPTVPRGASRLRATLSCDHTDEEIARLIASLIALPRPSNP